MQVKKKMTCEEFIRNNRGINGGADLPHQFLRELYASISQNEIRISADQQASGLVLGSPVLWTDLAQQAQSPRGTFFTAEGESQTCFCQLFMTMLTLLPFVPYPTTSVWNTQSCIVYPS